MTASEQARMIASQCWCDKRTEKMAMVPQLAEVFAEKIDKYLEALQWVSACEELQVDGKARKGYERVVQPLIQENI